jgi:hypothetical protein
MGNYMDGNAAIEKHIRRLEERVDNFLEAFAVDFHLNAKEKKLVREAKADLSAGRREKFKPVSVL